ncbi:MAG: TerC family protein [Syntrophorhabdales bacterium]|jgi:YjbE family integral membrane protein
MNWGNVWNVSLDTGFFVALASIFIINIILSGDNAVVIAMAVRSLGPKQRLRGIVIGTAGAVLLRIVLTFFCAKLLEIPLLKFLGGALITWIAVKLFVEGGAGDENQKEVHTLGKAVVTILVADLVMSLDNVLGVAGACKGNLLLLVIGLGTSIPIVVFGSNILSKLMDRFPIIVLLGAAVLGRVAGEMVIGDPFITKIFRPGEVTSYVVQAMFTVGVIVAGKVWMKWKVSNASPEIDASS